jgi:hypothetical protein
MNDIESIRQEIQQQATSKYKIQSVVKGYMDVIEEIINIPVILERLETVNASGKVPKVMSEIIAQSRVEFNYAAQDDLEAEEEADLLDAINATDDAP